MTEAWGGRNGGGDGRFVVTLVFALQATKQTTVGEVRDYITGLARDELHGLLPPGVVIEGEVHHSVVPASIPAQEQADPVVSTDGVPDNVVQFRPRSVPTEGDEPS